jgi:hypothetical protein
MPVKRQLVRRLEIALSTCKGFMTMTKDDSKPFSPPVYGGDEKTTGEQLKNTPLIDTDGPDRGHRGREGSGAVAGSGAGAGGTAIGTEDYDEDSAGGGGGPPIDAGKGHRALPDIKNEEGGAGEDVDLPPGSSSM